MNNRNNWISNAAQRRQHTLQQAREKAAQKPDNLLDLSPEEIRQLAHKLLVQQIEIEMQNERLRRTQGELEATLERYCNCYEMAPVGYLTLNDKGIILESNPIAAVFLNKARDEIVSQPLARFIFSEDHDIYYHHSNLVAKTGVEQGCEFRVLRKDHALVWIRMESRASQDAHGESIYRVVLSDITELKRTDAALRDSIWRLESIIDGTHVGTWEWNVESGKVVVNEVWTKMLGYTLDELTPISIKIWETLAHPDDQKRSAELLERHFAGELPYYDLECRIKHKAGHWVWIHDCGRVITRNSDGKPLLMFGSHTDITKRKQEEEKEEILEAQNRQLQKSESLGRMAGAIAHHFNNQLQVVMMNLDLAMRYCSQDEVQTDYLTGALESARKAAEMSSLMLTYLGQTFVKCEPMNLSDACRQRLPLLRANLPQNVFLDSDLPTQGPVISANASQIQQVLTHLVANASEAIGDGQGHHLPERQDGFLDGYPCRKPFPHRLQNTRLRLCLRGSGGFRLRNLTPGYRKHFRPVFFQ
jgi:PAS domain S-box-containing protein